MNDKNNYHEFKESKWIHNRCADACGKPAEDPIHTPADASQADDEHDKELGRWQDAIRDKVIACSGASDTDIDGGGEDSGDPLDLSLAEIGQGFAYIDNAFYDAIKMTRPDFVWPEGQTAWQTAIALLSEDKSPAPSGVREAATRAAKATWSRIDSEAHLTLPAWQELRDIIAAEFAPVSGDPVASVGEDALLASFKSVGMFLAIVRERLDCLKEYNYVERCDALEMLEASLDGAIAECAEFAPTPQEKESTDVK